jgi:DNA-binding response OmpR family regulator
MVTGFNTDVVVGDRTLHIQTEDKGPGSSVIETLVYHEGRILAARRLSYADLAEGGPADEAAVAERLQRQHWALVRVAQRGRLAAAARRPAVERRTILAVDDDPSILQVIERSLALGGHRVVRLQDPRQAVEVARRESVDLVLCDLVMPGLNGYGVVRALQAEPATARLPVVFLTGDRNLEQRVNAFRFGVVDYLTKPFSPTRLLRTIETLLDYRGVAPTRPVGAPAATLVPELQRDARTGVLRVTGSTGSRTAVLSAGHFVAGDDAGPQEVGAEAEFQELDFDVEELLAKDPARPVDDGGAQPSFADVPEFLRIVLLVDDNTQFRSLVAQALQTHGFRVLVADDAAAGLALLHEDWPWLVITDTSLPGLDGFELCRRIRSSPRTARLPVLFLSGWHDHQHHALGLAAGSDDYVSKLAPLRQLLLRVHLLLSRYATLSAPDEGPSAGTLEALGVPAVLRIAHATRVSGILTWSNVERFVEVRLREGEIVGADSERQGGLEALVDLLSWSHGRFELSRAETFDPAPLGPFETLLNEACLRAHLEPSLAPTPRRP